MGPTASGKSAIGLFLAQKLNAVIINADTMQCYRDLRVVTARPTDDELAQAPHAMYGIWEAHTHGNTALWQEQAVNEISAAHAGGKLPILLGGTGMYIKSLMEGIAPVPDISDAVRERVRAQWDENPTEVYRLLQEKDPTTATRLEANDKQRVIRALEVVEETGIGLGEWQAREVNPPFAPESYHIHYVDMPREDVYARIDKRFETMMDEGALEEVEALMAKKLPSSMPVMRAHGVPEIMAHIKGEMTRADAIEQAQQNTRNYAKRQMTWLRNQHPDAHAIAADMLGDAQKAGEIAAEIAKSVDRS